ncbi:MAG: hypothetical protein ACR2O3_16825 [Rhizobiaceae bacterium]
MRLIFRIFRYLIFLGIPALLLFGYFVPSLPTELPFKEQQVWKQRKNTPELAAEAVKDGYPGLKVDVTYVDGELYVVHVPARYDQSTSLRHYLAELDRLGVHPMIWLDIKNLTLFNETAIAKQLVSLKAARALVVESARPFFMFRICSTGLNCSVWAKGTEKMHARIWYQIWINLLARFGRVAAISVHYFSWDSTKDLVSGDFPKFVYTLPANANLDNWQKQKSARVLLTD